MIIITAHLSIYHSKHTIENIQETNSQCMSFFLSMHLIKFCYHHHDE